MGRLRPPWGCASYWTEGAGCGGRVGKRGAGLPTGRGGASDRKCPLQLDYQRQVATMAAAAAESDFAVSQAELSARQAMLENAADIKVTHSAP